MQQRQQVAQLSKVPLFANCSKRELSRLLSRVRSENVDAGHTLFVEGAPSSNLYVILSGSAVVRRNGRRIATDVGPGDVVGELSVILGGPRTATVEAETPIEWLVLDRRRCARRSTRCRVSGERAEVGSRRLDQANKRPVYRRLHRQAASTGRRLPALCEDDRRGRTTDRDGDVPVDRHRGVDPALGEASGRDAGCAGTSRPGPADSDRRQRRIRVLDGRDAFSALSVMPRMPWPRAIRAGATRSTAWPHEMLLRVRMGLHTGMAHERGGDYFGPVVNRAARIMGSWSRRPGADVIDNRCTGPPR